MAFGSTLQGLMRLAHVALAFILLVGVPMADAATCAGEERSSAIETSVASVETIVSVVDAPSGVADHGSEALGDAQDCIHGHCHHSTLFKDGEGHVQPVTVGATCVAPQGTDMVLTHVSASLERPPKS
jgi:hypothetical protein